MVSLFNRVIFADSDIVSIGASHKCDNFLCNGSYAGCPLAGCAELKIIVGENFCLNDSLMYWISDSLVSNKVERLSKVIIQNNSQRVVTIEPVYLTLLNIIPDVIFEFHNVAFLSFDDESYRTHVREVSISWTFNCDPLSVNLQTLTNMMPKILRLRGNITYEADIFIIVDDLDIRHLSRFVFNGTPLPVVRNKKIMLPYIAQEYAFACANVREMGCTSYLPVCDGNPLNLVSDEYFDHILNEDVLVHKSQIIPDTLQYLDELTGVESNIFDIQLLN